MFFKDINMISIQPCTIKGHHNNDMKSPVFNIFTVLKQAFLEKKSSMPDNTFSPEHRQPPFYKTI